MVKKRRQPTPAERVYAALFSRNRGLPLAYPKCLWPNPRREILAAITTALEDVKQQGKA